MDFPQLDPDTLEYVVSVATDTSMPVDEKIELIIPYVPEDRDMNEEKAKSLVSKFIEQHMQRIREEESQRRIEQAKNVGAYIEVIRSAPVVAHEESSNEDPEERLVKQQLLRQYDPDQAPPVKIVGTSQGKGKKKAEESKNNSSDDELIFGLGANENKLFKIRQREEMRAKAKQEQEEARLLKVQQKLKQQGNEIKTTSTSKRK
jgi:hypothetical protein